MGSSVVQQCHYLAIIVADQKLIAEFGDAYASRDLFVIKMRIQVERLQRFIPERQAVAQPSTVCDQAHPTQQRDNGERSRVRVVVLLGGA